jgi:thiosulfate/3-mercaptopyruvate sulfurtransferase
MGGELISTDELARILHEPDLRIFDCTTRLDYQPPGSDIPYIAVPGLDTFEAAHIPGADFLDIQGEYSDQSTRLRFMMAGTAKLEVAFRRHGVADDSRVYSLESPMWATRFWWMLESLGFSRASVLDGGFEKWSSEGRAIERGSPRGYPIGDFTAVSRPGFFVDKHAVLAARTIRAWSSSTRLARNPTRVLNRAATVGRVGFREASMFRRRHCMTPPPRHSQIRPMRGASLWRRA